MFDYVEGGHEIKRAIVVWQLLRRAKLHGIQTTFAAKLDCLGRDVDTFCSAVRSQHLQIRSRATADVENARVRSAKARTDFLYEALNDLPSPDIPPVTFLHFIEDR